MNSIRLNIKRNPSFERCPSCDVVNMLHRSRARNGIEILVKKIPLINLYICRKCGWRGYIPTFKVTSRLVKQLLYYMLFLIFIAVSVIELLRILNLGK